MTRSIFRRAAIEAQGNRLARTPDGDLLARAVLQAAAMLVLLATIGIALLFMPLPRTVTSEGVVTATPGPVRITAPAEGVVDDLFAVEGTEVDAGTLLMTLARPAEGLVAPADLQERIDRLTEARTLKAEGAQLRVDSLARQVSVAEDRLDQIDALIARSKESVALILAEAERLETLNAKGLTLVATITETQQDLVTARVAFLVQENDRIAIRAEIADLTDARAEVMAAHRAEDARLAAELAEVRSNLAALASPRIVEITAPVEGTIEFVQSRPGQSVSAQSDLMIVAPPVSEWGADLFLTARESAAVRDLRRLTVALTAPDGREFLVKANLLAVSTTPIPAENVEDSVKLSMSEDTPVYRARLGFGKEDAHEAGLYIGQPLRIVALLKVQSLFERLMALSVGEERWQG